MKKLIITAFALATFIAAPAAADVDVREHVEVVGHADVKVVPDEFVIRTNITRFDKSLPKASKETDQALRGLIKSVSALGVARKYIVADKVNVNPVTEGYRERGNFKKLGYTVSRDVMIVLHDSRRLEPTMREVFSNGVDRLSVTAGHTNFAGLTQDAQIEAARQASKKASRLSSALGRGLGAAIAVAEEAPNRSAPQSFVYRAETPDLGDTLSLGKISVRATVRVKFALK